MLCDALPIYLDYAATTPVRTEVVEAMLPYMTGQFGNAHSLHGMGRQAKKAMEGARTDLATMLGAAEAEDFILTSGGTESNNLAIKGVAWALQDRGRHLIASQIEHPAVLETMWWLEKHGWDITLLPVDAEGRVSPLDLLKAIRPDTVLVSVMHGNNEVGTLQPIEDLAEITRDHGILFHTDAVQTIGKMQALSAKVDMLSVSAHKFYGPKGVGFLYANANARNHLVPLIHGGGQERMIRSGTSNVPGMVGMVEALRLTIVEREHVIPLERQLQERLIAGILERVPGARLNGPRDVHQRVPGNVNFSFAPVEGEAMILRLDARGICASSGSACHGAQLEGSHVVHAMGGGLAAAKSTVRFTLGRQNTEAEIDQVLAVLPEILEQAGYFRHLNQAATL